MTGVESWRQSLVKHGPEVKFGFEMVMLQSTTRHHLKKTVKYHFPNCSLEANWQLQHVKSNERTELIAYFKGKYFSSVFFLVTCHLACFCQYECRLTRPVGVKHILCFRQCIC